MLFKLRNQSWIQYESIYMALKWGQNLTPTLWTIFTKCLDFKWWWPILRRIGGVIFRNLWLQTIAKHKKKESAKNEILELLESEVLIWPICLSCFWFFFTFIYLFKDLSRLLTVKQASGLNSSSMPSQPSQSSLSSLSSRKEDWETDDVNPNLKTWVTRRVIRKKT